RSRGVRRGGSCVSGQNGFAIAVGSPDANGRRLVSATLGKLSHRDRFDPDDAFKRSKFIDKTLSKFDMSEDVHEHLDAKILAAAEVDIEVVTANVISMADVKTKKVEWFWQPYIPAAAITDLSGDPNEGKSTFTLDLIARNSRGDTMPP